MPPVHSPAPGPRSPTRQRGFALVLVLWSLVLLTLITTRLVAGSRAEIQLAGNLRAAAAAEMLADAGVHEAMLHLLDRTDARWTQGGDPHTLSLPGGGVSLAIEDESGRVNPNTASEPLLAALLRRAGADAGTARGIAAAIVDWRSIGPQARPYGAKAQEYRAAGRDYVPSQAPFHDVDEVSLVLGMTPALLDRLRPYLTVFYEGDPDAGVASPFVLQAMRDAAGQAELAGNGAVPVRTYAITATAQGREGGRFVRRAVVRLGAGGERPYQVLEWRRTGS